MQNIVKKNAILIIPLVASIGGLFFNSHEVVWAGVAAFVWGGWIFMLMATRIKKITEGVEKNAMLDEQTGALSRARLVDALEREIKAAARNKSKLSLVMVKAKNIESINAMFDRQEGNECLKAIAYACQKCLRDTDYLGRAGGLLFCAVLPGTGFEDAGFVKARFDAVLQDITRSHSKGLVHVETACIIEEWSGSQNVENSLSMLENRLI